MIKSSSKPAKPHPDFALYAHASGKWAKKIRGQVHYFGSWEDPWGALDEYRAVKDDLMAGRTPRQSSDDLTLKSLVNQYLEFKADARDNGEIAARTFEDYKTACERLTKHISKHRLVSDLRPTDFATLKKKLYRGRGHKSVMNDITQIKMVFSWAYDQDLIDKPMRYGSFKKPSAKTMRLDREERGAKHFEAEEILALLDIANPKMRAMILLGINCGYGNNDVARLKTTSVKDGWIDYPRPKTGVKRRCNLWPETIEALQPIIDGRTTGLVFRTKQGNSFEGVGRDNPISKEFAKLQAKLDIKRKGRGFYGLRHTLQTEGEEADLPACKHIMGHVAAGSDMSSQYRGKVQERRIKRVTDHVRQWLFAPVVEALVGCFGCAESADC